MSTKRLWIIVTILTFILIAAIYIVSCGFRLADGKMYIDFAVGALVGLFFAFGFGALIGLLLALIPFRKKWFIEKFRFTFPAATMIALLGLNLVFGYLLYVREVEGGSIVLSGRNYEEIEIPANLDCSTVRNGKFMARNWLIERTGDFQRETNLESGEVIDYRVEWRGECEYVLTQIDDKFFNRIKVVAATASGYDCYVNAEKNGIGRTFFISVKRWKE